MIITRGFGRSHTIITRGYGIGGFQDSDVKEVGRIISANRASLPNIISAGPTRTRSEE